MYDELTRCLWVQIFGCGEEIFEPLEKLDSRFKLEDQYKDDITINRKMKKNVGSVMKALEGSVSLQHHQSKLSPFKHNLLSKEKNIENVSNILSYWSANRLENVTLDFDNIRTLFVPNLNIKELTIIRDEQRVDSIKKQSNLVDL